MWLYAPSDRGSAIGPGDRKSAQHGDDTCYEDSGPESDRDGHGQEGATSRSHPAALPEAERVGEACHDD